MNNIKDFLWRNKEFCFFVAVNVASQAGQGISLPLLLDTVHQNGIYFVLLFLSSFFGFAFLFLHVINVIINCIRGHIVPKQPFSPLSLFLTGVFDAINGVLVVFPTLPQHLAPVLSTAWPAITAPMMVLIRRIVTKQAVSKRGIFASIIAFGGCMFCFLPLVAEGFYGETGIDVKDTALWSLIFVGGLFAACVMTLATEYALKGNTLEYVNGNAFDQYCEIVRFEMYRSWIQTATMLALHWVDLLPWFGTASSEESLWNHVYSGLKCLFMTSDSPAVCNSVWPYLLLFALSYVIAYLTSDILTWRHDANVSIFVSGISIPISIWFFVFSPDAKGLQPASILPWAFTGGAFIFAGSMLLASERRQRDGYQVINDAEVEGRAN